MAVLLGVVLLDESVTVGVVVGFPFILAGSVLATGGARGGRWPNPEQPVAGTRGGGWRVGPGRRVGRPPTG